MTGNAAQVSFSAWENNYGSVQTGSSQRHQAALKGSANPLQHSPCSCPISAVKNPSDAVLSLRQTSQTSWRWGRVSCNLAETTDNGRALVAICVLMRKSQAEPCDVDAYPWTRRHRGAWEQCGCSPSPPSPSAICVCQGYLVVLGIWTSDNSATKVRDKAERPSLRCSLLKTSSRKSLRIRYIFFSVIMCLS